jgi:hypothetical protein
MAERFALGDKVGVVGEITRLNGDGTVTIRLTGYSAPLTLGAQHLSLVAKYRPPKRKQLFDKPD